MKVFLRVFLAFIMVGLVSNAANALEISGNTEVSGNYLLNEDTLVAQDVLFSAYDIQAINSLTISNYGQISGRINVCASCVVEIRNSGVFDAEVLLQNDAKFVQIISTAGEITDLGLSSDFFVLVRNGVGLNFTDVMSVASNADSVELSDTDFNAGAVNEFDAPSGIKLSGDVVLHFDDVTNNPVKLFKNVSGDGAVFVDSGALDSLHVTQTYRINNDIFFYCALYFTTIFVGAVSASAPCAFRE